MWLVRKKQLKPSKDKQNMESNKQLLYGELLCKRSVAVLFAM